MKLFCFESDSPLLLRNDFDQMSLTMSNFILKICQGINKKQKNLIHTALFLFHCEVRIASFHKFDRFIYACASILVSTKLTEHVDYYPIQLIRIMRKILRENRGLQPKEDDEQKMKVLVKKLFEAELVIMINIGFQFDLELALFWLKDWERYINNYDLSRRFQENLTDLYKTNVVLYFQPELIALSAISMGIQSQRLHFQVGKWNQFIRNRLETEKQRIREIVDYYNKKIDLSASNVINNY